MSEVALAERERSSVRAASRPGRGGRSVGPWGRVLGVLVAAGLAYLAWAGAAVQVAAGRVPSGPADVAAVLGAAQYDGTPSGALAGRLDRAVQLYRDGLVAAIVVTGGNQPGDRTTEAMTGFAYLRDRGVPEEALLVENGSTNTWEQLLATELILGERGLSTAILVSDPSHCRRLLDTAAELGIAADVAPTSAPLPWSERLRETAGVAVGDVIGFRRLSMLAG